MSQNSPKQLVVCAAVFACFQAACSLSQETDVRNLREDDCVGTSEASGVTEEKYQNTENSETAKSDVNPYFCPAHWDSQRLLEFLLSVEEKPRTIRRRSQFVDAVCDSARRLLKDSSASDASKRIAWLTMSNTLHYHACWGDEGSDQKLIELVKKMEIESDPRIQREVKFLLLERALIEFGADEFGADKKALLDLPRADKLLDQGYVFCSSNRLLDRHLRLASNLIRVANLLESEDKTESQKWKARREKEFARFGALFEKSADLRMSRYGKSLAEPGSTTDHFLGQPLELAGAGLGGEAIDIRDFAGNIVVVDFWATWCGPCVRETPELVRLYAELADKEFEIIGINLDDDPQDARDFAAQHDIGWRNVAGEDAQRIAKQYSVRSIPMMMLIDRTGKILLIESRVSDLKAELNQQMGAK